MEWFHYKINKYLTWSLTNSNQGEKKLKIKNCCFSIVITTYECLKSKYENYQFKVISIKT
jgi:hypothetical protein